MTWRCSAGSSSSAARTALRSSGSPISSTISSAGSGWTTGSESWDSSTRRRCDSRGARCQQRGDGPCPSAMHGRTRAAARSRRVPPHRQERLLHDLLREEWLPDDAARGAMALGAYRPNSPRKASPSPADPLDELPALGRRRGPAVTETSRDARASSASRSGRGSHLPCRFVPRRAFAAQRARSANPPLGPFSCAPCSCSLDVRGVRDVGRAPHPKISLGDQALERDRMLGS